MQHIVIIKYLKYPNKFFRENKIWREFEKLILRLNIEDIRDELFRKNKHPVLYLIE